MLTLDLRYQRTGFQLQAQATLGDGVTGLYGPSGCGKSTLLALVAGLLKPQQGQIRLGDDVLFDAGRRIFVPPHRRHIGLMFQDAQLFPHLSVRDNLLYGYRRLQPQERQFGYEAIIALLEIGHLAQRHPRDLSGGERQRVALGRALLYSPRILLLDEPLSSLDERLKGQILPFLRRVREETRIPMLYVSHSLAEIRFLTDIVLTLENGRLGHLPAPRAGDALMA
ncbi:MAG: molybdenum ABC transporter ATP-binding protein [Nevskiaceae bacterium]|nr:MAG: molybdenum ABC transporter ATP-binding protein [Nevskiaceae bacterium]